MKQTEYQPYKTMKVQLKNQKTMKKTNVKLKSNRKVIDDNNLMDRKNAYFSP